MNSTDDGLFPVEEYMPCAPADIKIGFYVLPSTLGRVEQEEAAARILSLSLLLNQWVGVSWPCLVKRMQEDAEVYQCFMNARKHNSDEEERVGRELARYNLMCFFTLGFYRRFKAVPTAKLKEVPTANIPLSGIFVFGPQHVVTGIHELIERGFLKLVKMGEGENRFEVLFPTSALVQRIMERQRVAAR